MGITTSMSVPKNLFILCLIILLFSSCGSPEEKKIAFYNKGKTLFEQGDYVKARLEFKNALQIDLNFVDGYFMLGQVALRRGEYKDAYSSFLKVVELEPDNLGGQAEFGRLLLAGREFGQAMDRAELILRAQPGSIDGLMLKAAVFYHKKQYGQGLAILTGMLEAGEQRDELFLLLASIYQRQGLNRKALKAVEEGLRVFAANKKLYLKLAEINVSLGRYQEAIAAVRLLAALEPDNSKVKMTLASLMWDSGDKEGAGKVLREILTAEGNGAAGSATVAKFYLAKKEWGRGESILRQGIELYPDSFSLRFLLSNLSVARDHIQEAVSILQQALSFQEDPAHPQIIATKTALSKLYLQLGEIVEAENYVDQVIKESPGNVDGHFYKGRIALLKNDGPAAIAEFRIVTNEKPQYVPGYLGLAKAYILNGQPELAKDGLGQARELLPHSQEVSGALVQFYLGQNNFAEAIALCRENIQAAPDNERAYNLLGKVYTVQGDFDQAEWALRKAAALNTGWPNPHENLAKLYQIEGEIDKAVAQFKGNIESFPSEMANYLGLGGIYEHQQEYRLAINIYEQALLVNPSFGAVANNLAFLLAEHEGSPDALNRAMALVDKVLTTKPHGADTLDTKGWVYHKMGKRKLAHSYVDQALRLRPDNSILNYHMAVLLYEEGQVETAADRLHKALAGEDFPSRGQALNLLQRLEK